MVALLALVALAAVRPAPADAAKKQRGELRIKVGGLPKGEPAAIRIVGPGLRRTVRGSSRTIVLRRLRAGRFRVTAKAVRVRRTSGPVRRGATAKASTMTRRVRVRAGRRATTALTYDRILNPVEAPKALKVLAVAGPAGDPTSITVAGRPKGLATGDLLSIPPRPELPRGLLSKVTSLSTSGGNTIVSVRAATVFEAAPTFSFDVPGTVDGPAVGRVLGGKAGCKLNGVNEDIFTREIKDIRFRGGWNTRKFLGREFPIGVQFEVAFRPEIGVTLAGIEPIGGSCSASLSVSGMAGPIPITASLGGSLSASAGARADVSAKGSVEVKVAAKTIGVPPGPVLWSPTLSVDQPKFTLGGSVAAEAKAGIGVDVKAGLGNDNVTSIALKSGASVDFSAVPGTGCSWDVNAGALSVEGKVLGWSVESPSTPPLFSRNLWKQPCGAAPPPPAPTPAPAPTPEPPATPEPPVVEDLLRARMTWDTETDVDLYIWDAEGHQVSYLDTFAIPGARLQEDITPGFGPEEFFETTPQGRTLTYGVCMFRDDTPSSTNVELAVTDPDGTKRTIPHTLGYEGDYAVLATSPDSPGYVPEEGWCRSRGD